MESYTQCHYCKKNLTSPLELVCRHSYCSECLTKEIRNDKIICPICNTEHSTPASSLSSAKQDTLAPYIIGLNSGAPYTVITDDSPPTIQAECSGCKKMTDLRVCYHCEKPLCVDCRGKHYESQRKDVDSSIQNLQSTSQKLVVLAQALNTSRAGRIEEYKKMKDQVTSVVKDLTKKIHDEETDLQKKLDARITSESDKIAATERELKHLEINKEALEQVADKYRQENNQMILIKMHKDYLDASPTWKSKLETHAGRLNVKHEEELHFHPASPDPIVGTLSDSKKVPIHAPSSAKKMAARNDQTESRACSIM